MNNWLKQLHEVKGTKITTLDLKNNRIRDEGAKALAEGLKDTNITTLILSENNIGYEEAKALAEVLKDTNITTLDLNDNYIGDEGTKALAEVLKDTNITTLDLACNYNLDLQKTLYDIDEKIKSYKEIDNKLFTLFHQDGLIGGLIRDEEPGTLKLNIANLEDSYDVKAFVKQYISAIADITSNDLIQSRFIRLLKNYYNCTHEDAKGSLDHMQRECGKFMGISLECSLEERIDILLQCKDAGLSEAVKELLLNRPIFVLPETENTTTPKLHQDAVTLMNEYKLLPVSKEWGDYTDKMISVEDTTESVYPDIATSGNTGGEMNYPH